MYRLFLCKRKGGCSLYVYTLARGSRSTRISRSRRTFYISLYRELSTCRASITYYIVYMHVCKDVLLMYVRSSTWVAFAVIPMKRTRDVTPPATFVHPMKLSQWLITRRARSFKIVMNTFFHSVLILFFSAAWWLSLNYTHFFIITKTKRTRRGYYINSANKNKKFV